MSILAFTSFSTSLHSFFLSFSLSSVDNGSCLTNQVLESWDLKFTPAIFTRTRVFKSPFLSRYSRERELTCKRIRCTSGWQDLRTDLRKSRGRWKWQSSRFAFSSVIMIILILNNKYDKGGRINSENRETLFDIKSNSKLIFLQEIYLYIIEK